MDAVRLTTALRVSGREGRLGVVEVVDVDGEDPVIVAAAGAAVGAAVMVEVLGAEAGSAVLAPAAALSHGLGGDTDAMRVRCRLYYNSTRIGILREPSSNKSL